VPLACNRREVSQDGADFVGEADSDLTVTGSFSAKRAEFNVDFGVSAAEPATGHPAACQDTVPSPAALSSSAAASSTRAAGPSSSIASPACLRTTWARMPMACRLCRLGRPVPIRHGPAGVGQARGRRDRTQPRAA